jgi:hypothetical protein
MSEQEETRRSARCKFSSNVLAGTGVGVLQSVLFNPWDRALYLSVKEKRPFLLRANFAHPYQVSPQRKKKKKKHTRI